MDWHVETAAAAEDDMEGIYQYIAVALGEPEIAWKQTKRIRDRIVKLNFMPERNQIIQEEPWKYALPKNDI
jgi:plasmid stabilization system protein ParE